MALTDEQIGDLRSQLNEIQVELEQSELPQDWPETLKNDYAAKGEAISLLRDVCLSLLDELENNVILDGPTEPNGANVRSNRNGLFVVLPPNAADRQIWYNPNVNVTSGWRFIANR